MSDFSKYVSLKTIVSFFLDENDKSMGDFDKAWVLAFRALVDLNYNISAEPKSIRIPVEGNKTIVLPSDYLSWSKIGILNDNGEVCSIKVNNGLSILKDNNPNRLSYLTGDIQNTIPVLTGNPFFLNYFNNGFYNNLYGVGRGLIQYGECRVDERNNVIIFNPDFQYDSVILEYLSSPEKDGDYQIQTSLQEAVIAFIAWKMKVGQEKSYYDRAIEARRRLPGKKVTLQNINQVIREATGMYLRS